MPNKTVTVFDIIPDLDFDTPTLTDYYPTRIDKNCGDGDED